MNQLEKLYIFLVLVLVDNDLCGKLVSSLEIPTTFNERIWVTSAPFFIHNFSLQSCERDNFTFKVL